MPVTLQELKDLIEQEFPGSDVNDIREEEHRMLGTIRWDNFRNYDSSARNRLVTQKVRNRLGLRGINVGILFPVAPGENR